MAGIYPAGFRRDAVALVRSSDKTVTQIAREIGLNRETLRLWSSRTALARAKPRADQQRAAGGAAAAAP
jgi:transposase-like protein